MARRIHQLILCKVVSIQMVNAIEIVSGADHGIERSHALMQLGQRQTTLADEMKEHRWRLQNEIGSLRRLMSDERRVAERAQTYSPPSFFTDPNPAPEIPADADPGAPLTPPVRDRVSRALAVFNGTAAERETV
jgi:hypothetical protein